MSVATDYSVADFMRAAAAQKLSLGQARAGFEQRIKDNKPRMADIGRQMEEAVEGLASLAMPSMTADAVQRARKLSAYAPLLHSDPLAIMRKEEAKLKADIARMEADPRYADRFALRAPGVGKLARELQELEEYRTSINDTLRRADHPRLERLISAGYGTDEYKVKWWRLGFYSDWKAGDEILEKFPDKKDFDELRGDILGLREDLAEYDARIGELRGDIMAGEALEREHDEAVKRLANLSSIHLADWQGRLRRHFAENPEVAADRMAGDPDLESLLKASVGLRKKLEYLEQLEATQLSEPAGRIQAAIDKLDHDMTKYSRPKRALERFPAAAFERRFRDRQAGYDKVWRRYDSASSAIYVFDDYRRADLARDFLWWDLMTDGRVDGGFIPEVESFHSSHPDYAWRSEGIDDAQAAAAAAEADRAGPSSEGGALVDAS